MDLNKVMLIGNLTRAPEGRTTANGQTVCSFGLATNRVWTDASGQKQTQAEFHNIVAWGKLADICTQYLAKGRKTYVEGRLQTREWEGQDGVKRQRTEIVADNMIILDRAPGQGQGGQTPFASAPQENAPAAQPAETDAPAAAPADDGIKVENIPF
ncbi:MAG: single-stranded DNA-binding protein [bacterium]|nr:single-stranded DNA-binding protein [bacterium]